jgi:hypothetical protein
LKDKVNMVLTKGETPDEGKWNTIDLKFMIQWFKRDGDKAVPKNKDGILLLYRETYTRVVESVTYREENITGVDVAVATGVANVIATADVLVGVGVSVPTDDVCGTGVFWSLSTATANQPVATAAASRPPYDAATRNTVAVAQPSSDTATRTAAARPTSTQGKPTFDVADAGIPDDVHASVAVLPAVATTKATAAFSIHNNEDDDWDLAPIGPRALGNIDDTGQNAYHVDHSGLQVFGMLASSDASEFDDCDGFD